MEEQTLKEKMKKGFKAIGIAACLTAYATAILGGIYLQATYLKPIRTETKNISGIIVGTSGGDITYAKFLKTNGTLGEAIIPLVSFGLENRIVTSLAKNQPLKATIEEKTQVSRSRWGKGPEEYQTTTYVKSLEEVK